MNFCHTVSEVNHFLFVTGNSVLVNHAIHLGQRENLQVVCLSFNLSLGVD